jgi:hypothetical protein
MNKILKTIPLKPGKLEAYKAFLAKSHGEDKAAYTDFSKRYELKNTLVWYRRFGEQDYAMILHDINDDANPHEILKRWLETDHPYDLAFKKESANYYDFAHVEIQVKPELIFSFEV